MYATSKPANIVGLQPRIPKARILKRYDLMGRPVTKDHRGVVIEGSREDGYKMDVESIFR
jgi:hypothetical protein